MAITLPLLFKGKYSTLKIAFVLLFIPWGLHYNMTQDWSGNLLSWNIINNSTSEVVYSHGDTAYELFYTFLVRLSEPVGFMGFQILIAIFALLILYIFIKKYVTPNYYWFSIYILMILPGYALLYINSIRQTIALSFTVLASMMMMNSFRDYRKADVIKNLILAILCIYLGANVHSSAYAAFLIIPIFFISKYLNEINVKFVLIISNLLFFSRYFFDITQYQQFLAMHLEGSSVDGFLYTVQELENIENISIFETLTYFVVLNLVVLYYNKLTTEMKYMGLLVCISMLANGFLINTLARVLMYFNVYLVFVAPKLLFHINNEKNPFLRRIKVPVLLILFAYTLFAFVRSTLTSQYQSKWSNFETLFDAPFWF